MADATELRIRAIRPDEIAVAIDWAAAEGWNPGLADAECFGTVDAEGFLIGELDGAPAATISCLNYDDRFAFLGFYIVRGDLRGRGYGLRIWNAAVAHAGARTIGLDGVVAQQDNYRKSGFRLAYANISYASALSPRRGPQSCRWRKSRLRHSRRTMRGSFRRRARPSCERGSARAGISAARSCATAISPDRKSTRLNSSHLGISYAVFCLKKKNQRHRRVIPNSGGACGGTK